MALVTFGGAYAVLSYVAQAAVEHYGWLTAQEMVRGLALAETTPGPLIMVVQFVAFLGAYRDPGDLDPWVGRGAGVAAGRVGDVRARASSSSSWGRRTSSGCAATSRCRPRSPASPPRSSA